MKRWLVSSLLVLALSAQPGSSMAEAEAMLRRGDAVGAWEKLEALLKTKPAADPEAYVMGSVALMQMRRKSDAEQLLEAGWRRMPRAVRIEKQYALLLGTLPFPEAETRFLARLKERPTAAWLARAWARVLVERGQPDPRTEEMVKRAARLLPADFEAQFRLGAWACLKYQNGLCLSQMRKSLPMAPSPQSAMECATFLGIAEETEGNVKAAEVAFLKAWRLNEQLPAPNADAMARYVEFLLKQKRSKEAEPRLQQLLQRFPDHAATLFEQAKLEAERGDGAKATATAERALGNAADNAEFLRQIHQFLARQYFALQDREAAERHQQWLRDHP
jgi:tetratricopeptide (TPR) repeat protein